MSCGRVFPRREVTVKELRRANAPRNVGAQSSRAQADKQERRVAKDLGARQTIASGQTPIDKGDVRSEDVRVECKYTDAASFSLKEADLEKIAAATTGRQMPLFYVEFRKKKRGYYVVPEEWFRQMLEAWNDQNNR